MSLVSIENFFELLFPNSNSFEIRFLPDISLMETNAVADFHPNNSTCKTFSVGTGKIFTPISSLKFCDKLKFR